MTLQTSVTMETTVLLPRLQEQTMQALPADVMELFSDAGGSSSLGQYSGGALPHQLLQLRVHFK